MCMQEEKASRKRPADVPGVKLQEEQDQEDDQNGNDDPPSVSGDVLQAADHEDNVSLVRDTIFLHDDEGKETPFNYVQANIR